MLNAPGPHDHAPRPADSPTLWDHLARVFLAGWDPEPDGVRDFAAFCGAELARNAVVATGFADAGMTVTLQDGTRCLLAAPRAGTQAPAATLDMSPHEFGVIRITDPRA